MKVQLPFIGKASGTTADMIYQSYNGATYMRAKPWFYHYPDTEKQQRCQAQFYAIQRQWWPIYNHIKAFYPKSQRKNTNLFNRLSAGIYLAAETYKTKPTSIPPLHFGIDNTKEVEIKTSSTSYSVIGNQVTIKTKIEATKSSRKFNPLQYNIICINLQEQLLFLKTNNYTKSDINETFVTFADAKAAQEYRFYISLISDNFASDFYLTLP